MNALGCWTTALLAVLTTVTSTVGGVLPQKTFYHQQHQHLLHRMPHAEHREYFPAPPQPQQQTHHVGIGMERWSNAVETSNNLPLQDTDSDASMSFTDNDRSVYDPGVIGECFSLFFLLFLILKWGQICRLDLEGGANWD